MEELELEKLFEEISSNATVSLKDAAVSLKNDAITSKNVVAGGDTKDAAAASILKDNATAVPSDIAGSTTTAPLNVASSFLSHAISIPISEY